MDEKSLITAEDAAKILKISKYTLYELVKRGEIPARRIGRQLRFDPANLQQHRQGNAEQPLSSEWDKNTKQTIPQNSLRFVGSHDPVLELLIDFLKNSSGKINLVPSFKGSMDGLIALYRRKAEIAGIHLWDDQTEEYNLPFIHYVLPGESVAVVNLVQRVQGWIVHPGNPLDINTWEDIAKKGLRLVNRQKGSGTRLRLDSCLRLKGISPAAIDGYEVEENTHMGVACRVANREADAGIGVQSVADRLGLDFAPLFHERYDLICLEEVSLTREWQNIIAILNSDHFQHAVHSYAGYDTTLTGTYLMGGKK